MENLPRSFIDSVTGVQPSPVTHWRGLSPFSIGKPDAGYKQTCQKLCCNRVTYLYNLQRPTRSRLKLLVHGQAAKFIVHSDQQFAICKCGSRADAAT